MIKFIKKHNIKFILLGVLLGIALGICTPSLFDNISFLGEIFINLLKLFALPLICSALIASIGGMNKLEKLKKLSSLVITYMLCSEVIAVTIALILFNVIHPGIGVDKALILNGSSSYSPEHQNNLNFSNFLLSIFPHNIFDSLSKFDLLPVVIFSIMFGIGCAILGEKASKVVELFTSIKDVTNQCLHGVMLISPIGIFSLIGSGVASINAHGNLINGLMALISFVIVLFMGLFLQGLWQFLLVVFLTKQHPSKILKVSTPVFLTAFATSSSVATLPIAMESANELKADEDVTKFMLPLCAAINIGGMMMYEVAASLFFSQMLGVDLSLSYQILLAIACILGGMAEGGIPETSLVSLVIVFKIVNVPLSAISILLPLDRIIDRVRTMVNIFGNMCGVIIVSKFANYKKLN